MLLPPGAAMTVMTYDANCYVCGGRISEAEYETSVIDFTSKPEDGKPLPRTHARCWAARDPLMYIATRSERLRNRNAR